MLQDCFPARLSVIYVVNEPRWLLLLVALLRPLLSRESMQKKWQLCGDGAKLLAHHIPAASMPTSLGLGGTLELDLDAQLRRWERDEARRPAGWDIARLLDERDRPGSEKS